MNLRLQAAWILSSVIKEGQSLTAALDHHLALKPVENSKDRAFIQALCYGVIRQYHQLDFILQQLLSKALKKKDSDIKMLLLIGLYQLKFMRVKSHAAVSETVSAANKKSWAKSLINGVLRQYMREQQNIETKVDHYSSASSSHPQWLINKFQHDWPEQVDSLLIENNSKAPLVLRVNLRLGSRESYLKLLSEHSIQAKAVSFCSSAIILDLAVNVEKLPGFEQGLVSVQDTAAQLAAELLDVQPGQSVLDLCAAPGGKTAAIIERQAEAISMLAVDIDETRLERVKENLQRLKLQAQVVTGDATKPEDWAQGQTFDRILIDAPCSALGVIRRHPDIKVLRHESDIAPLIAIQQQILNVAWELLAPGGIFLYATCSVLKQENEQQIEAFLANHKDASDISIETEWGIKRKFGRQILTGEMNMDGFYYAKLRKQ